MDDQTEQRIALRRAVMRGRRTAVIDVGNRVQRSRRVAVLDSAE